VGTDVILHISNENEEFLEEKRLFDLVRRFCLFLPYPIFVNDTLVNSREPLWLKTAAQSDSKEYGEFYKELYPFEEEPLFWVHLNVDYPFHVKGILYFPRIHKDFDFTKNHVKLFCNRVFVSDDCKDILPDYLQILKGVIDSPDIPLNVSRSHLQVDKTVRALSGHISKKVVDALSVLYKNERERFYTVWEDSAVIVKLGMLNDDKFLAKAREFIVWKTTKGNWITVDEALVKNPETIYYVSEDQLSSPLVQLYEEKDIDVIISKEPLDSAVMSLLERGSSYKFKRIDAEVQSSLIDPSREKSLLDADGKSEGERMAAFFRQSIGDTNLAVEAKSLSSTDLPAFISLQEDERRLRDYLARISKEKPQAGVAKKTLVINTNSPLISALCQMSEQQPELAKMMAEELYDLTALSQRELDPKEMKAFLKRSGTLLEKIALFATKK
jgi:molecular chaperone HtpG